MFLSLYIMPKKSFLDGGSVQELFEELDAAVAELSMQSPNFVDTNAQEQAEEIRGGIEGSATEIARQKGMGPGIEIRLDGIQAQMYRTAIANLIQRIH